MKQLEKGALIEGRIYSILALIEGSNTKFSFTVVKQILDLIKGPFKQNINYRSSILRVIVRIVNKTQKDKKLLVTLVKWILENMAFATLITQKQQDTSSGGGGVGDVEPEEAKTTSTSLTQIFRSGDNCVAFIYAQSLYQKHQLKYATVDLGGYVE